MIMKMQIFFIDFFFFWTVFAIICNMGVVLNSILLTTKSDETNDREKKRARTQNDAVLFNMYDIYLLLHKRRD